MKLAEGEDPADPDRGLAGLERLWEALRVDEDMSVPAAWLSDPKLDQNVVATILGTGGADDIGAGAPVPPTAAATLLEKIYYLASGAIWLINDGATLLTTLQTMARQSQLFSLDPIRALTRTSLNTDLVAQWASSGGRLLLAVVSMDSGKLRYVTETGALLERDLRTPVPDLDQASPACQPLVSELVRLDAEIRVALVSPLDRGSINELKTLRVRQREARNRLLECSKRNPVPAVVDLRAGVLASAAIPAVFGLERLAGEMYCDGGLRELVPIQAAIDSGADEVFALSASPIGLAGGSFQDARIADIGGRVHRHPAHRGGRRRPAPHRWTNCSVDRTRRGGAWNPDD